VSVRVFTGPAGSGKTTQLLRALDELLAVRPLGDGERVLAVTRIHGARARLADRLAASRAAGRFECVTFDRFAWEVAARWRGRRRDLGVSSPSELAYDETCSVAAALLAQEDVARWVRRRYPVVVVDELQDCRGGRLDIVRHLARHGDTLAAADGFQDLNADGSSEAMSWVEAALDHTRLTTIHRTRDRGLLAAANALREGRAPAASPNFKVFSAPTFNVAASFLATGIAWAGGNEVAVISATGPEKSKFVADALVRLSAKPFERHNVGPYRVRWEQQRGDTEAALVRRLALPEDPEAAVVLDPRRSAEPPLAGERAVTDWMERRAQLRGDVPLRCAEVVVQIKRAVQQLRSRPSRSAHLTAMTIHQAKNREFERVLILWPLAVVSNLEAQRRLLYNAITRAKKQATLIIQDPKRTRLQQPPFADGAKR
jgi:hypothetical protein